MKPTNLNPLFIDQVRNFAHLLGIKPFTKQEFIEVVKRAYNINNPKTSLFISSVVRSEFETIQLNNTRDAILFNQ